MDGSTECQTLLQESQLCPSTTTMTHFNQTTNNKVSFFKEGEEDSRSESGSGGRHLVNVWFDRSSRNVLAPDTDHKIALNDCDVDARMC